MRRMFALRAPKWNGQREPAVGAGGGAARWLSRAVVVVALALLLAMLTVSVSQACVTGAPPIGRVAQSAPQVAKQHGATNLASAAVSVVKPAILQAAFVGAVGHGHGLVGSCCCACSAVLVAEGWSLTRNLDLHRELLPQQKLPLSAELNAQFRPPRTAL